MSAPAPRPAFYQNADGSLQSTYPNEYLVSYDRHIYGGRVLRVRNYRKGGSSEDAVYARTVYAHPHDTIRNFSATFVCALEPVYR